MTIQDKNVAIAEMLGWKKGMLGEFIHPNIEVKDGMINIISPLDLKFHSDANWQFEAIDWIEKQKYNWQLTQDAPHGIKFDWFDEHNVCVLEQKEYYIKPTEAIFEALYQFSQYLKQKK